MLKHIETMFYNNVSILLVLDNAYDFILYSTLDLKLLGVVSIGLG